MIPPIKPRKPALRVRDRLKPAPTNSSSTVGSLLGRAAHVGIGAKNLLNVLRVGPVAQEDHENFVRSVNQFARCVLEFVREYSHRENDISPAVGTDQSCPSRMDTAVLWPFARV